MSLQNKIFIPIGSSCSVTWYLDKNGYRKYAFPFDWTVTPIQSAIELLNNNFSDFLNPTNLLYLKPTNRLLFKEDGVNVEITEDIVTPVYDKKYHILYVHDFSTEGKDDLNKVLEKYQRRVIRLQKLLSKEENSIFFIYDNREPNDWQRMQYLQAKYNFLKLTQNDIDTLSINRNNIKLISLDEFKTWEEIK